MNREKVIIDTDIGDFIDDTLALCLAAKSSELEIIGVTTVFKHVVARAQIASNLLKIMGYNDIPVIPGTRLPLEHQSIDSLYDSINPDELPKLYKSNMESAQIIETENAVTFMARRLSMTNEPITLVSIGPLTNIATLLIQYPEVKTKIKRILIMGGAYYMNRSEYNIMCDPEAAKIVFESNLDITCIGLDVTTKCKLSKSEVNRLKQSKTKIGSMLYRMVTEFAKQTNHMPCLHDPLAIAIAFKPDLVKTESLRVGIECKGEYTRGMTFNISDTKWWEQNDCSNRVKVCKTVDHNTFFDIFFSRVLTE